MVNMKASAHQGVHKRALASQGEDVQVEVTKAEKLKLRADAECVNANGVALRVLAREKCVGTDGVLVGERNAYMKAALVAPETLAVLARAAGGDEITGGAVGGNGKPLLLCRPGADFVLSARAAPEAIAIEPGVVLLGEAQRLSLHVCEDESYEWVPFERPSPETGALASLAIEAQLLTPPADGQPIEADALQLGRALAKRLFDDVVTDNEIFMYSHEGTALVLRVTASRYPENDDDDEDGGGEDGDGGGGGGAKHCFRGLVDARTKVYVGASTVFCSSASQRAVCEGLKLSRVESMPERQIKNCVHVATSDGEVFPVHRTLLRSCIALTKAVRDTQSAQPEVNVDVDCATFDRVLLFLEAASKLRQRRGGGQSGGGGNGSKSGGGEGDGGKDTGDRTESDGDTGTGAGAGAAAAADESGELLQTFAFDMHTLPSLSLAATSLGCRLLRECCEKRLGAFEERVGIHRWHEIVETNSKGGCMVTMEGMVFDLLAWLPEHPGGSTIIPQQALNVDCTVFFELYHASRESFTYLREFYVGELHPADRELVPAASGDEVPSQDFRDQLREFAAPWRFDTERVEVHKSF